ncbi:putative Transcriptional family [Candidatus Terasakiella magnetica]|uniref:Putative Transcriptional family n=1 Tax=Candidatus Terasakiella magnetica TaxID=1867952 RepID=A0A1C3RI08_9PROT|nr:TetR/AcrR family transcriptional regulator [Candidatus Terasakiella magnetica]SCA56906.1 putative Transcriptional family [Candidatus Terasakiella magnetica]
MGYPEGHKEKTRDRIIAAARKLWKSLGYQGASVDKVMQEAGLTRGGFYAHFKSKDDLFSQALDQDIAQGLMEEMDEEGVNSLDEKRKRIIDFYLSVEHRDHPESGCPLTALTQESARLGEAPKTVISGLVQRFSSWITGDKQSKQSLAALSMMVGTVTLARATKDSALSDEILQAAHKELDNMLNDNQHKEYLRRKSLSILNKQA